MRTELTRLITDWEKNGQGDGRLIDTSNGPNQSDDKTMQRKFGGSDHQSPSVLNDHAAFSCNNKCSYLRILWEEADKHHLLASTLQHLDRTVGAPNVMHKPSVYRIRWTNTASPSPSTTSKRNLRKMIQGFQNRLCDDMLLSLLNFVHRDLVELRCANRQQFFASRDAEEMNT
jgi:hypothetical protein